MTETKNKVSLKEKFKSFTKTEGFKMIASSLIAIFFGILIGFIVILINNPSVALLGFGRLLMGPLNNPNGAWIGIGQLMYRSTPLIFTGLAVAFAFKTGVFNIGASGQYMMGLFAAAIVGILGDGFGVFQWPIALLAGALAGALWGAIPGLFKAFYNVNIVISGIMLNYIAVYFINGMLGGPLKRFMVDSSNNRTIKVDQLARTPYAFLDKIFPNSGADFGFILGIIAVVIIFIIMNKTVFGRELKSVGFNKDAAKYAGVNEKKSIVISMAISGMLAGIGGALFILAPTVFNLGNAYAVENVVLAEGFDGIPIALLGHSSPIGVLLATLFITYIKISNLSLQSLGIAAELVSVIISVILYFSAFSLIISKYLANYLKNRKKRKEEKISTNEEAAQ